MTLKIFACKIFGTLKLKFRKENRSVKITVAVTNINALALLDGTANLRSASF